MTIEQLVDDIINYIDEAEKYKYNYFIKRNDLKNMIQKYVDNEVDYYNKEIDSLEKELGNIKDQLDNLTW